jgi:hypothetical protein
VRTAKGWPEKPETSEVKGDAMKKTPRMARNWFRAKTVFLVTGLIGLAPAGYSFQNQDFYGQEEPSPKQITSVLAGLARPQIEEFLLTARVVQEKPLAVGVTNSQRATLDNGRVRHDAHIQTVDISKTSFQTIRGTEFNFRDCYKYNMAAYELDKLLELNMIPVSVERNVGGHMAAVTWWVDDSMLELDRKKKKMEPPDQHLWNQQMYLCRVFDQLIYNTDRNLGNLVIAKDWRIWMIDHTRAFRTMKDLQNPKNLVQCDRRLLDKLRELNGEVLQQRLGHYLNRMEIDAILSRRDRIVKFFDEQVSQKGEAAVLFDLDRRNR